jgi:hypothetical protein
VLPSVVRGGFDKLLFVPVDDNPGVELLEWSPGRALAGRDMRAWALSIIPPAELERTECREEILEPLLSRVL